MNDLRFAVESNDIAVIKSLLVDGSVSRSDHIDLLLRLAAKRGLVEIVAHLLDAGARVDHVNDFCDTSLHAAVRQGHANVVSLLLARNANVSLRNRAEETPIIIAIQAKNAPLVMMLIDAAMAAGSPPDDATTCLAATVSTDVIHLLLFKHRIDLAAIRDDAGRTPLHECVRQNGSACVLDMLIEVAGVNIDVREKYGCTATHIACLMRNGSALARLVAAGANLDLTDNRGNTPLHYSRFDPTATDQFAVLLLAAGANVHTRSISGRTPLHWASEKLHASVHALVACGADLDAPDDQGVTPRQLLASVPTSSELALAHRKIAVAQLSFVRRRAFEICIAVQSIGFDALCMCEILLYSCGPLAGAVPFHRWWQIATTIKHWRQQ
jgi:ankyrin repeat protein